MLLAIDTLDAVCIRKFAAHFSLINERTVIIDFLEHLYLTVSTEAGQASFDIFVLLF